MNRRMSTLIARTCPRSSGWNPSALRGTLDLHRRNSDVYNLWWNSAALYCWRLGMGILAVAADERVRDVRVDSDTITVDLMDGRTIAAPLVWYPRLLHASPRQRQNWKISGAGYGIHWPDIDEDLSTEGLLRGCPAPAYVHPKPISLSTSSHSSRSTRRVRPRR